MKKLLTILAALMMSVMLHAQTATAPSAGDGTAGNPYQIATLNNLYWISQTPSKWSSHYIQTANINASATSTWNSGQGWQPIGFGSGGADQFRGTYNGQNFTISGLYINRPGTSIIGLFGSTYISVISNLGLINVNITGSGRVGALVGQHDASSTITNCYSTGTVSGNTEVGGLVGYVFQSAKINKSYSTATVTANTVSGGLAGSMNSGGIINECYATGNVTNLSNGATAGGLVGSALFFSQINKSYARGNVTAGQPIGGLVGSLSGAFVDNAYSTGLLTSASPYRGGLVGESLGSAEVNNSFWDVTTSTAATSSGGVGRTTAQMKTYSTFFNDGWDYVEETTNGTNDVWGMNPTDNNGYPFLAWQGFVNQVTPVLSTLSAQSITGEAFTGRGNIISLGSGITQHGITWNTTGMPNINTDSKTEKGPLTQTGTFSSTINGLNPKTTYYFRAYAANAFGVSYGDELTVTTILQGDGSVGNPYLIATWEDIQWIAGQPYNSPVLAGHFLQVADIDAGGASMYPIGKRATGASTPFSGVYNGNGHTISNVVISYPSQTYMGFFNSIHGGEVKRLGLINFSVSGSNYVGALSGGASNAIITECYATGVSITAIGWGGGLIGTISANTIVSKCYTTGNITGTGVPLQSGYIGGLVGRMGVAEVNNSYTHVHVAGSSEYSGGFTGFIDGGTIINSYSTGTVTMQAYFTSGFVGWDLVNTVVGSFWDIESSNRLNSRVGVGLTTAQMTQYVTFYEAGWDLVQETVNGTDDIWGINPAENNGYPFLMWQGLTPSVTCPPSVTTLAATNITNDKATLNGNLTRLGIPSPTSHGFVWNTTGNPNIAVDNVINLGAASSTGAFSHELTGIQAISTYYYRAFVTTDLGTFTGHVQTFKTVLEGSGTAGDPYKIVSLSDLLWIRNNSTVWDKHFEQVADIDASLTSTWHSGAGFSPIPFSGHYDGKGHSITGLYINRPTTDNQGLFSSATNATIKNLSVLDANITGNYTVGIIVGTSTGSTITNCTTSGTVNGFSIVGGIVGRIETATIVSNCNSSASIHSRGHIFGSGGIVGSSAVSTIQGCMFDGAITSHTAQNHGGIVGFTNGPVINCETNAMINVSGNSVGGIAGSLSGATAEVLNCNAMGTTQGVNDVGGLVGKMVTNPVVINSQSSGNVIGHTNVGGLVGALRASAKIENSWSNAHVTGVSRVGGAVGEVKDLNALAINSYSTGTVEGTNIIGGFVGAVETSAIVQACYSTATVTASSSQAGGFAGKVELQGKVFDSYALGSVIGSNLVGGFAGSINNTGTQALRCFSAGKTTSTTGLNVTAFAGNAFQATVQYNLADLETAGLTTANGASGKTNTEMRTISTYLSQGWDFIGETTNGTNNIWGINGIDNQGYAFLAWQGYVHSIPAIITTLAPDNIILGTSIDLRGSILELNGHTLIQHGFVWNTTGNPNIADDTFHNFGAPGGVGNFSYTLSGVTPSTTYYLRTFTMNSYGTVFYGHTINYYSGPVGEGTEAQPFLIASLLDLKWLMSNSQHWNKHYLQIADIDASETLTWDGGKGISEIGNSTNHFTGTYDGGNKSITKMNCRRISGYYIGMFGYINNATIKNLTLEELYMEGSNFVGGLVGFGAGTNTINNCKVSGIVRGWNTIGGLIGVINGTVSNCHFVGEVRAGHNYVGGLIGRVSQAVVTNSSATAQVTAYYANAYAGGFAGTTLANATITKSWSNSIVVTTNTTVNTSYMGGFVGSNLGAINNCYAMGSVTAYLDATFIGGFIGNNTNTAVRNSYSTVQINGSGTSVGGAIGVSTVNVLGKLLWDVTTSGVATSAGGTNVVGHTTAVMNDKNTYLDAGFDFLSESINGVEDIWGFNPEQNNSYPFFAWQEEFDHKYSPSITINNVSNITGVSATINAEIVHLGESQPIEHGFYWNTTGNPGLTDNKISLGEPTSTGVFNYLLTNLKPVEQYYIIAFFTDENDTYWGNEQSFNTPVKEIFFSGSFIANNKMYDGTTIADANTDNLVADGVVLSASGVVISAISFEFESSNAGNNKTVIMSGVTLDGVDKDRYVVNLAGAPTSQANITPKAITVIADAKIKVYGDADPALSYVVTGLVGGDTMSGALTRAAGTGVGTYAINQGTLTAGANYTITYTSALLTITAKPITVVADAKSKVYGAADPVLTYVVTGLVGADAMSGALTRAAGTGVGTYAINQGTLSAGANYTITYTGAILTITAKAITVTADAKSKVYGAAEPALTYVVVGLVGTDAMSGALARVAGESVGPYAINQGTLSAGANYTITYTGALLTITAKAITVTADAKSKVYGVVDPALTYIVVGLVGTDAMSGALARVAGEGVGTYAINQGTLTAGANYTITYTGALLTITAKAITVTADAKSKVYGTVDPALTYAVVGLVGTDAMSGALTRVAGEGVGTYAINQGTLSAGANYTITYTGTLLTITAKAITVTADAKSKVYGAVDPAFTYVVTGLVGADAMSGALTRAAGAGVGTYAINQGTLSAGANYTITYTGALLTITAKAITVTADAKSKVYGAVDPALTFVVVGLVGADAMSGALTRAAGAGIGTYAIIQGTLTAGANYTITYTGALLTITPKPLTITANSFNKTIGEEYIFAGDEFFTSDIIDGDEVTSVTLTSDGAASAAAVGTYDIIPSDAVGVGLANYDVSYVNGTLTVVDQTEVTLSEILTSNKVYDGTTLAEVTNWGTLLDVADGDIVTLDTSNAIATFNNKNVGNNKVVTITGLALSGVDADKYYINNHFSNADIIAKDLVLSGFYADDKVYDGDVLAINHGFDDDRIVGDILLYSYNASFENKNAGENKNVFFTGIEITGGADMNNYNLTVTSGSAFASIFTREVIVLNAQALDKDYDGFTNAEVINAELFNHIATDDVILEDHFFGFFAQANVGLNIPIETQMSLSGFDASNYDLIQPDYLVADISQKVISVINAAANNKVYDATTDAEIVGAELSGVVSGDVVSLNNETVGEFAQAGVGVEINVTSFMMISGDDAGNYLLVQPTLFADITHKEITVGGSFVVSDKVYDGNNIAALNENLLLIEGVIAPDAITIESVEIEFSDINVGDNVMVNITDLTITGNTENYILSLDNTPVAYANITPAQLSVINAIAQDKVYDGTAAAVITGAELAGVIGDDVVVLDNNTIGTFTQVNVGADLNVLSSMTISGADSDNYELVQPLVTASITAKPLTITAQSLLKSLGTEFVFEGDEFFVSEMILGDEVTSVTLTSDGAQIDAVEGDYDIIPSDAVGVGLENYDISYVNGTLSVVDQVELFLSGLVIYDKVYDGNNTAQVANWGVLTPVADGDDVSLDFSSSVVTFANKLVGNNKIVSITGLALTGANADNYFINNHSSQASITVRTLALSNFTADDKEYDATTAVTGTGFLDNRVAGDVLTLTYDASFADKTAGQDKDVNYTNILIVSGADMNNYILGSTTATAYADITQKALTIAGSFTALDKEYDGTTTATIDENNLSLVGVITDDVVTINAVAEFVSSNVANDVVVNLLSSTITGTDALNYELSFVDAPTTTANITAPPVVYYTLTITIVGSGTVEVDGELYTTVVTVEEGTILDLEAIAAEGWEFNSWTGEVANTSSAVTTINMNDDKAITATFTETQNPQYTLTVVALPANGGTVSGGGAYEEGEEAAVSATANSEFDFTGWFIDDTLLSSEEEYLYTMPAENVTLTARFQEKVSVSNPDLMNISIYPNPFRNTINITSTIGINSLKMLNLLGQIVMEFDLENLTTTTINTRELQKGIYFISVKYSNGKSHVIKVVKE